MIVHRLWFVMFEGKILAECEGWFLFGFILLYARDKFSERTQLA